MGERGIQRSQGGLGDGQLRVAAPTSLIPPQPKLLGHSVTMGRHTGDALVDRRELICRDACIVNLSVKGTG